MGFVWIAPAKADFTADEKSSIRESVRLSVESARGSVESAREVPLVDGAVVGQAAGTSASHGNDGLAEVAGVEAADFAASVSQPEASATAPRHDSPLGTGGGAGVRQA